jgi:hypothetical protein
MSFTPYQVDFSVKNTSKTFGFSKKRVSFKFGIANNEAIEQGLTGAHCRGSEHEVIFTWSLNSGKRQILADGKDVHYSESGLNGWTTDQVFQHHFLMRVPNLGGPLRCHLITQPANRDVPSIQPFDLRVNGISFFNFAKIYELGSAHVATSRTSKPASRGGDPDDDPYITPEERKAIAAAKLASIRDIREREGPSATARSVQSAPTVMNRDEGNLINLLEDTPSYPPPAAQPPSHFVSSITLDTAFVGGPAPAPYGQQPYNNYALGAPPPASQPNPYGQPPAPQQPDPYAQQQPNAYGQPAPLMQPDPYAQQPNPYGQPPAPSQPDPYAQQPNTYGQPPDPYAQQPPTYGQPPAPMQPDPYAQQITPYGQPPAPLQPDPYAQQQPTTYGQPPTPQGYGQQQQNQFAYQQPPTPQGYYGGGQQYQGFASPPGANNMMSPSGQSIGSYGSAPAFAQPPRQPPQPQYQQGYPQY